MVVSSSDGYDVNITLQAVSVVAPSSCANGYSFKIDVDYTITFTGTNIPSNLYTLQGYIDCGGVSGIYFNLPKSGGSGTARTSNSWTSSTNCETVTPEIMPCSEVRIQIQGPGIPSQTIVCGSPLPIELMSFYGELTGEGVLLNWVTSTELNNDYFTIERSNDLIYFTDVGTVDGSGTSNSLVDYELLDADSLGYGVYYYRIKQVDYNGDYEYSYIVYVEINNDTETLVYPTESRGLFTVNSGIQGLSMVICNEKSEVVLSDTLKLGENKVDMSSQATGIYFVKLFNDSGENRVIKVIKI